MRIAPDGLALVQDLVNTRAIPHLGPDLLADRGSAQRWLREAGSAWATGLGFDVPELSLSMADVEALRVLRTDVEQMLAPTSGGSAPEAPPPVTPRAEVALVSDSEGRVRMMPVGAGRRWVASAVWSEVLLAQRDGRWLRLKLCREPFCRSAFYDTSRNTSGVWHDVRTCGNSANLRASRLRRKMRASADGGE